MSHNKRTLVLTARYGLEDIFDPIILGLDPSVQVIIIIIIIIIIGS